MRISIVTITKNDPKGLERTANSLLRQDNAPFEWILVDGGSCEATRQQASALLQAGLLTTIIREGDAGPYEAMAKGAHSARGDYLCFLNGADAFSGPATLANVGGLLEQHQPDVLLGWGQLGQGIQAIWLAELPAVRMASLGFCHQAAYYRREVFEAVPFRNASQSDNDTFQLAELIERGYRMQILPELLADRDTSPGLSAWGEQSTRSVLTTLCQAYGFCQADAEAILAFRRRAEASETVLRLLQGALDPSWHPHTLSHLAILCLDTLTLRQATALASELRESLRGAAIAALQAQLGALTAERLCQQLRQAVQRRDQLLAAIISA
jgi:hypothetical protein